jgi:hypothetical protein
MDKPRTPEEIKAEIKKLKAMKPGVRHFGTFGNDNWKSLNRDVEVLEKEMTEQEVYRRQKGDDEDDTDGWTCDETANAIEVVRWMNGEKGVDSPSKNWKPLWTKPTKKAKD